MLGESGGDWSCPSGWELEFRGGRQLRVMDFYDLSEAVIQWDTPRPAVTGTGGPAPIGSVVT